ncbi:unnamed protein product [Eruca vesicaria subsp. sativa]|uniref:F-box domain-containing protein n=1 Tax=Eruca vesicaria subsp. sativa TaxID=29727 RepID=A0ABC8JPS7_ERUVS|nr:unnamed protein product [Eruca vesicaria subsp. sativa]
MKKSTRSPLFHEPSFSFSWLPEEILLNCLARVSRSQYRSISSLSKTFYYVLSSPAIYAARSQIGTTEPRLYICCESLSTATTTRSHGWYNLMSLRNCDERIEQGRDAFISEDGREIKIKSELMRLVPVKNSSFHLCARLKEANLAVGSEIYQIGGINKKGRRSRSVCVLDCRSHTQRRAPKMRVARESAKACVLDGNIYVMGGCSENKECWGEVFDLKTQTWDEELPLPSPSGEDVFDCIFEVLVLGAKIYVITEHNKYAYDPKEGTWLLLDTGFAGLKSILELGIVWCVVDNIVFKEFSDDLFWYDLSCGKWLVVEGLEDLLWDAKVNCRYRMIQLVNYGGKLVIVWVVLPDVIYRRSKPPVIPEERTWFAVIRLEKHLTSSGLAISGEIEQLNYLVHGSYNPLTCLSVSL